MSDIIGICPECKEWTGLSETCCGAGVYAEGSYHAEPDEEDEEPSKSSTGQLGSDTPIRPS
jgi:hypothetical protein